MIVDAHVHLWDEAHTPQPWMGDGMDVIRRVFGPDDLEPLLDRNGIDAAILVQGACLDSDTDYLCAEAERQDWVGAVTVWLPLADPPRARERLGQLRAWSKVRGVRHLIHDEADRHWIMRDPVLESLAMLEREGLLLELPVVYPRHFDDVPLLATLFPRLTLVIDHLGKPPLASHELGEWEELLGGCAAAPNVCAKVSGLNTATPDPDWTARDLAGVVQTAFALFGADRLMCGSDWPVALLNGDYDRVWRANRDVVSAFAEQDRRALLGETARRIYGLDDVNGGDRG